MVGLLRESQPDNADSILDDLSRQLRDHGSTLRTVLSAAGVNAVLWRIVEPKLTSLLKAGGGTATIRSPSGALQAVVTMAADGTLTVKIQRLGNTSA